MDEDIVIEDDETGVRLHTITPSSTGMVVLPARCSTGRWRQGYWLSEYVSISRILRKARGQYARAYLYTESDDNDVMYFLLYQMRVLLCAIHDLHQYLARKATETHAAEELVRQRSIESGALNVRQLALLQHALKHVSARYTVESHRISHGTSYKTARSDLLKLVKQRLLVLQKSGKAFVSYPAPQLRDRLMGASGL